MTNVEVVEGLSVHVKTKNNESRTMSLAQKLT